VAEKSRRIIESVKRRILLLLVFAACLGFGACSEAEKRSTMANDSAAASGGSPASPGQASSAEAGTFRNAVLGFEFSYPRQLDQPEAIACKPALHSDGRGVSIGSNVYVVVDDAASGSLGALVDAFLQRIGAEAERRTPTLLGGVDAMELQYRLMPSGRFGSATFAVRAGHIYRAGFEARSIEPTNAQCGGVASIEIAGVVLSTFRFVP
jgi:hypothetical protein